MKICLKQQTKPRKQNKKKGKKKQQQQQQNKERKKQFPMVGIEPQTKMYRSIAISIAPHHER